MCPAICPDCRIVFLTGIQLRGESSGVITGSHAECPQCHGMGIIPDGVYQVQRLAQDVAEELADQPDKLRAAARLAREAADGKLRRQKVIERAHLIHPRVAKVFRAGYAGAKDVLFNGSCFAAIYCAFDVWEGRSAGPCFLLWAGSDETYATAGPSRPFRSSLRSKSPGPAREGGRRPRSESSSDHGPMRERPACGPCPHA
jgi:hypothetical protein